MRASRVTISLAAGGVSLSICNERVDGCFGMSTRTHMHSIVSRHHPGRITISDNLKVHVLPCLYYYSLPCWGVSMNSLPFTSAITAIALEAREVPRASTRVRAVSLTGPQQFPQIQWRFPFLKVPIRKRFFILSAKCPLSQSARSLKVHALHPPKNGPRAHHQCASALLLFRACLSSLCLLRPCRLTRCARCLLRRSSVSSRRQASRRHPPPRQLGGQKKEDADLRSRSPSKWPAWIRRRESHFGP